MPASVLARAAELLADYTDETLEAGSKVPESEAETASAC